MGKNTKRAKSRFALGFTLAGVAIGAGAALAAVFRQKQREQVYHEAEIKAMNELDDLMAENESACASCDCMEDCALEGGDCCAREQMDIFDESDQPDAPDDEIATEDDTDEE